MKKKVQVLSITLVIMLCFILSVTSGIFHVSAAGTNTNPVKYPSDQIEKLQGLGDTWHYNGIIFADMTAEQADTEGAIAVGGDVQWGTLLGYDAGGAYDGQNTVQLGHYTNEDQKYPTVLFGGTGESGKTFDTSKGTGGTFNVKGGPIVMSRGMLDAHNKMAANRQLKLYGYNGDGFVVAEQELLDEWFADQKAFVTRAGQQYIMGNDKHITLAEFSNASYIEKGAAFYENEKLTYNGKVDKEVLIINVLSGGDIGIGTNFPISADWVMMEEYEVIIFNFPNAVNVSLSGDPQVVRGGEALRLENKTWPDANLTGKAVAERNAICEKVLYNFPSAENIDFTNGVFLLGSVMAPKAAFSAEGGSINGQLIADSFVTRGGMELHAHRFRRRGYDIVDEEDERFKLSIMKYIYDGGPTTSGIGGAGFQLVEIRDGKEYYFNGEEFGEESNAETYYGNLNGRADIENIPPGSYLLREVYMPDGYETDDSEILTKGEWEVIIDSDQEINVNGFITVPVYNKRKVVSIEFLKVSSSDEEPLNGAVFALYNAATNAQVGRPISSGDGGETGIFRFEELTVGNYYIRELAAPDGYELDDDEESNLFYFSVEVDPVTKELVLKDENGTLLVEDVNYPVKIANNLGEPKKWITIFKYGDRKPVEGGADTDALGDRDALEGAQFSLWGKAESESWKQITENQHGPFDMITGKDGLIRIPDLDNGLYRLVEEKAPSGYEKNNSLEDKSGDFPPGVYACEFEVKDGAANNTQIDLVNYEYETEIQLLKLGDDPTTADEDARIPLKDIRFGMEKVDDKDWGTIDARTDESGVITIKGLSAGRYRMWESVRDNIPNYQDLEGDIFITVSFDSDGKPDIQIEFYNKEGVKEESVPVSIKWNGAENTFVLTVENYLHRRGVVFYKVDSEIYQEGYDDEEYYDKTYLINYLEGAEFQLQRRSSRREQYINYGETFKSEKVYQKDAQGNDILDDNGNKIQEIDEWGNPMTAAVFPATLPYGQYRVIEITVPDGYDTSGMEVVTVPPDNKQGYVLHTFTFTEDMLVSEKGSSSQYYVTNKASKPRGDINVKKTVLNGEPIEYQIPFKLWEIYEGAENWTEDVTLEAVLPDLLADKIKFRKYVNIDDFTSTFLTDTDGEVVIKDISPGIYLLFEHYDSTDQDFLDDILYMLDNGEHTGIDIEDFDPAFYYHTTLFKVTAVDENNREKGVFIEWVQKEKEYTGEAVFDKSEDGQTLGLQIVNKQYSDIPVDIEFLKTNTDRTALAGAEFTLYINEKEKLSDPDKYKKVESVTSDKDGKVLFNGLTASWKDKTKYLMYDDYKIVETKAPFGYLSVETEIIFRLQMNPMTKMLDLYFADEEGNLPDPEKAIALSGGIAPDISGFIHPDNTKDKQAKFITQFDLGTVVNIKEDEDPTGDLTAKKVGTDNPEMGLRGAAFQLYYLEGGEKNPVSKQKVTNASGEVQWTLLKAGTYRLEEVEPPDGYQHPLGKEAYRDIELKLNSDKSDMIVYVDGKKLDNKTVPIEFANDPVVPPSADLNIIKERF